jgi:hypothetical protein
MFKSVGKLKTTVRANYNEQPVFNPFIKGQGIPLLLEFQEKTCSKSICKLNVFSHSLFDQSHYLFEKELKRTTQI